MPETADIDILVYGATGFTGRLVAEYLLACRKSDPSLRIGLGGRNASKLETVRSELGASSETPLLIADADDPEALAAMARRARVVISTTGPYQLYGSHLVETCAVSGVDYVDLCGEPAWMHRMIDAHHETARDSGARIVFSCGFDSIPFDLGVLSLQMAALAATGFPLHRVKCRVLGMRGTFSGGTLASLRESQAASSDPAVAAVLRDPFALTPGFAGPDQPSGSMPEFDEDFKSWVAPFVMAAINTRNVHRSNYLMGHRYGIDFVYDEMIMAGPGPAGEATARAIMEKTLSLSAEDGPKPGDGPSKTEREAGSYSLLFQGRSRDGQFARAIVKGDRDPGYGSTSKMVSEAALCLLREASNAPGGVWTPAAVMGEELIERLQANAGVSFKIEMVE